MRLVLFSIAALFLVFAFNCGHPQDKSEVKSTKPRLPNQGFVLAKPAKVVADSDACPKGQKGGRIVYEPVKEGGTSFSSVTCFTASRTSTDARESSDKHRYPERKEFAQETAERKHSFEAKTLLEFCEQNQIEDLGARFYLEPYDTKSVLSSDIGLMSCDIETDKIRKIEVVASEDYPGSSFDMRLLQYFPNVVLFHINSNAIIGQSQIESIESVKYVVVWAQGADSKRESELLSSVISRMPNLEMLELTPHKGVSGNFVLNIDSINLAPKLKTLVSGVTIDGLSRIGAHPSIETMEMRGSVDQLVKWPESLKGFRYEIDTKSFNWEDYRTIEVHSSRFER